MAVTKLQSPHSQSFDAYSQVDAEAVSIKNADADDKHNEDDEKYEAIRVLKINCCH